MITFLKILFGAIFLYMTYVVVSTSLASNLFEEWSYLAAIPWMSATLKDFYANTVIIALWALYKERSVPGGILWVLGFVLLGSIATSAYVLVQLFRLKAGEGIDVLVTRRS